MSGRYNTLTFTEITALWTTYLNESMLKSMLTHMLSHVDDQEIKAEVQQSYQMAKTNIDFLVEFFQKHGFAKLIGFSDEDVYTIHQNYIQTPLP